MPNSLYPLFVNANEQVPLNKWVDATAGTLTDAGKVKSKIGDLAYRPGWHAGEMPVATHIGGKSDPTLKAPDYRPGNQVWAEVEMPNDVDWQTIANQRAQLNKAGKPISRTAHITDQLPEGGHYRYKTNPNMTGDWLIGGSMKVNKVLTDDEVKAINEAMGVSDLPRIEGKSTGGKIASGLSSLGKKLMPLTEREANKAKFLENSKVPNVMYHGTNRDFNQFMTPNERGIFLSPNPKFAESFAADAAGSVKGGNIMPVHVKATNPFDLDDPAHIEALGNRMSDLGFSNAHNHFVKNNSQKGPNTWAYLETPAVQKSIKDMGHDSYFVKEGGTKNLAVYDPSQIKSAIGNEGTYNMNYPDITKKRGGKVKK